VWPFGPRTTRTCRGLSSANRAVRRRIQRWMAVTVQYNPLSGKGFPAQRWCYSVSLAAIMDPGDSTDVHPSVGTGILRGKPGVPGSRGGTALLGAFAILLQAALFGWHTHPLPLSSRGAPTLLAAAPASDHEIPAAADNDCQICFALGHQSAASIGFAAVPPPIGAALPPTAVGTVVAPGAPYLHFRSRAPPRA
jgi:hypothetical protein